MDLSRFKNCKIKAPAICDLMTIPEFVEAVNSYDKEIDDEWVIRTTYYLAQRFRTNKKIAEQMILNGKLSDLVELRAKYKVCYGKILYYRKTYPEYSRLYETS